MTDMDLQMGSIRGINDNSDTIVLMYYKAPESDIWQTDIVNMDRLPVVGEYVALSRDSAWYEVKGVVHMAFPLDYDAEVYAIEVPDKRLLRQSFGG